MFYEIFFVRSSQYNYKQFEVMMLFSFPITGNLFNTVSMRFASFRV